jgi:hypothetical protein
MAFTGKFPSKVEFYTYVFYFSVGKKGDGLLMPVAR